MMKRVFIFLIIFILSLTLTTCPSKSNYEEDENIANSENIIDQREIQDKINSAKDGDTVEIPSGILQVDEQININVSITLKGAGIDNTIISKNTDGNIFYIRIDNGKPFRITGITFESNKKAFGIYIRDNPKNFRIDNNKFHKCRTGIFMSGYIYGVIDHNTFIDNFVEGVGIHDAPNGDDEAWNRESSYIVNYGDNLGHPEFVFIENNDFIYTGKEEIDYLAHAVASNHGARYVFRYNNITAAYVKNVCHLPSPIDVHGNYSYGRGTVAFEIYNNTINSQHSYRGIHIRGGTGVIYNNTFIGDFTYAIHLNNYRSWTTPNGETSGGCPIGGDDPYYCADDYPCIDQINNLYIWNNNNNGSTISAEVYDRGYTTTHIKENRDYYHAQRPSYTPYTYPHPLVTD